MIPLRDVVPTRTPPFVTVALIAAHAVLVGVLPIAPALIHLLGNAGCLWSFGNTVEDRMGHGRFLVFCGGCGAIALVAQPIAAIAAPWTVVGLAGVVAGVLGAYFVLYPESRIVTLIPFPFFARVIELPAVVLPCAWFVLQFGSRAGTTAVVALVAGAAGVRFFRRAERMRVEWWNER